MSAFRVIRRLRDLLDVDTTGAVEGDALVLDADGVTWVPGAGGGGGGGAPTDATYLVTTADGDLSAEVVVGATPGGELGGTWASPTVDATHSGSSHASVQAAAEATAAAALALEVTARNTAIGVETTNRIADVDAEESARISAISGLSSVYQAKDASLDYFATVDPSNNVKSILTAADYAAIRTLLGLVIGTNVQAYDTDLTTWAGLTPSAFFQTLVDDANAATARATLGIGDDGWTAAGETWTYASADSPTFTFTIAGVDLTSKYAVGQRIKLTQTTAKYFIITKVAFSTDTTITVYGGTDYTLANATITSPFWSMLKAPYGFPLDPTKWTVTVTDTSDRRQASPVQNTWYNNAALSISVPIGVWNGSYSGSLNSQRAANGELYIQATLSTANNSQSDANWTINPYIGTLNRSQDPVSVSGVIAVTAKTTYYLNSRTQSTTLQNVGFVGTDGPTIIKMVCAYL